MGAQSTSSPSSKTQQQSIDVDTPNGVITVTAHTLITELINIGWPVATAIEFGCSVADQSMKTVAAMRDKQFNSITVN